jgi:hypothetical protein
MGNHTEHNLKLTQDYEPQFGLFHDLMQFRVREILLVSSFYDAFVLEEDGRLSEKLFSEYIDLNLRYIPRIHRVSTAEEALKVLQTRSFHLVITMTRIADMNPMEFGGKVKELEPDMPVVLLTYEWVEKNLLVKLKNTGSIDKVFYWSGDTRILLAIIKYVEDMKNVERDSALGVRVILVIEDSPKYYSIFLPIIYTEIMLQTRLLISEGVNDLHRLLRMRARPKILMAENYEEGLQLYQTYKQSLLGVISDVRFPREGEIDFECGFKFADMAKGEIPDLPFLIQSSNQENREVATKRKLSFLNKNLDNLLLELRHFILNNFGFGDFVFRNPDGTEICRAGNLVEFEKKIQIIPEESLYYHAQRNHISIWLRARTEFEMADQLRPKKASDFKNSDELRDFILDSIRKLINQRQYGVITDFPSAQFDSLDAFVRLGNGSLGGKARGIAFLNTLLMKTQLNQQFEDVEIHTPKTFVVCSEVFEKFMEINNLQQFAINEDNNDKIAARFLQGKLPADIVKDLETLLSQVKYPLAVRSSSLLEDSQSLPFAGLYSTYMLPNNHKEFDLRFKQLRSAIKLVFASVFYKSPKEYVRNTSFRIEEEKMAVIIQQVVGQRFKQRFYPVVAGVAQSYNFYPISYLEPSDGVVELALGLGATISDGGRAYRFSPNFPEMNPPYSSIDEFMEKSQNKFYSLSMDQPDIDIIRDEKHTLCQLDLAQAEEDGIFHYVASTYSVQDNVIRDTLSASGPRLLTFANILKYEAFPLSEILKEIFEIGCSAFGSHVELEFAVNLFKDKSRKPEFYLLQIRPMVAGQETIEVSLDETSQDDWICASHHAMGNGVIDDIHDIVFVDPDLFDISKSIQIATEVGEFNQRFIEENRNYILMGFGRWGTNDRWLGIPVEWYQISKARVVVESNIGSFIVDPSQGSHFFHNMISLRMGYFHIKNKSKREFVHWEWLQQQPVFRRGQFIKHLRFDQPLKVKLNGRTSSGVILK